VLDALSQPLPHFFFNPTDCPNADFDSAGKLMFGLELIDHGPAQARALAHLRES
jgi:hypothetical protein